MELPGLNSLSTQLYGGTPAYCTRTKFTSAYSLECCITMATPPAVHHGTIPQKAKFVIGGVSAMVTTLIVHPLDLIKNRMQLSGEGGCQRQHKTSLHAVKQVIRREGLFALYNGLSAGLLRQGTYGTTRLGLYTNAMEMTTGADGKPPSYIIKVLIGISCGGLSALVWTPTDLCLVRMLADGRLPPSERRGYTNAFNAMYRICREEGIATLWRGCVPTVSRAMVVNASELATYTQSKQFLLASGYFKDNVGCHFGASMVTGIATTVISTPLDVAKTRIQNMKVINGKPEYTGLLDVFGQTVRKEGVFSLWKGFMPYYVRIGPYTVCLFVIMEQLNRLYLNHYNDRPHI